MHGLAQSKTGDDADGDSVGLVGAGFFQLPGVAQAGHLHAGFRVQTGAQAQRGHAASRHVMPGIAQVFILLAA